MAVTDGRRHLVCVPYSVENLHRMAAAFGIGRHWFHPGRFSHYDVPARRVDEVTALCVVVSPKDIVRIVQIAKGLGSEGAEE
jgi:hypothetical protein